MTDQLDRDIDQTLRGWMRSVAPDGAPGRLLEETFGRTMMIGQARALPWARVPVAPRRRAVGRAAGWIAVLIVIAIVAAALFGTGNVGRPSPRPTISGLPSPGLATGPQTLDGIERPSETLSRATSLSDRLARPEGFEPPTY